MLYAIFKEDIYRHNDKDNKFAAQYTCLPVIVKDEDLMVCGKFCHEDVTANIRYFANRREYGKFLGLVSESQLPSMYQYIITEFGWGDGEEFLIMEGFPSSKIYSERIEYPGDDFF